MLYVCLECYDVKSKVINKLKQCLTCSNIYQYKFILYFELICLNKKMHGYVNINFFRGENVWEENNINYSIDPQKMQYIRFGANYDDIKNAVYDLMQIIPYHWNAKMSL